METEEKRQIETGQFVITDWRKQLIRLVVILVLTAVIYRVGVALGIWVKIDPSARIGQVLIGLILSWTAGSYLLGLYGKLMGHLLLRPLIVGFNHLQNNDYEAALESFRQFYDHYDRHPWQEKWYPFLMLDTSKYSFRETALFNQGLVHGRLGNYLERVRCYEQVLDLNPDNEVATSSLNFIAAVIGGEVRPVPRHIPFRVFTRYKPKSQPWWQGCMPHILFWIFIFLCGLPAAVALALLLKFFNWEAFLPIVYGGVFLAPFMFWAAIWIIGRLVLMDFYRGERCYRKKQYQEGIQAFLNQAAFLRENPWIDKWRWLFLPRSGLYSYQEWSLLRVTDGYEALNEGDRLLPIFEQILALNPNNGAAIVSADFIKKHHGEAGGSELRPKGLDI